MRINVKTLEDNTIRFIIIYSIMPIVSRMVSIYLTTYFYMLVVLLTFLLILVSEGKKSFSLYISILLPFIIFEAMTFLTKSGETLLWGYQVLLFLLPVMLGYYILKKRNYLINSLTLIICAAVIVTVITTIIGVRQYPNAARTLATVDSGQNEYAVLYSRKNIGGYSFVYTVVLLYPMLILAFKEKRINLVLTAVCTVAIFMLAIYSEYTIALLLVIASSSLFLFKRDLKSKDIFILAIVTLIFFILFSTVFSNFFGWLGNTVGSEKMSERLNALSNGKTGLEDTDDNRLELYMISMNTFFRHPLLGTFLQGGGGGTGGHAFILDSLAKYGIIGGACLYCMYRKIYRVFLRPFRNERGYGYILWAFIQAIFLSTINTGAWIDVLALYIPILATIIFNKDIEDSDGESVLERVYEDEH